MQVKDPKQDRPTILSLKSRYRKVQESKAAFGNVASSGIISATQHLFQKNRRAKKNLKQKCILAIIDYHLQQLIKNMSC